MAEGIDQWTIDELFKTCEAIEEILLNEFGDDSWIFLEGDETNPGEKPRNFDAVLNNLHDSAYEDPSGFWDDAFHVFLHHLDKDSTSEDGIKEKAERGLDILTEIEKNFEERYLEHFELEGGEGDGASGGDLLSVPSSQGRADTSTGSMEDASVAALELAGAAAGGVAIAGETAVGAAAAVGGAGVAAGGMLLETGYSYASWFLGGGEDQPAQDFDNDRRARRKHRHHHRRRKKDPNEGVCPLAAAPHITYTPADYFNYDIKEKMTLQEDFKDKLRRLLGTEKEILEAVNGQLEDIELGMTEMLEDHNETKSDSDGEPAFREPPDFPDIWQKLPTAELQKVDLNSGPIPDAQLADDREMGSVNVPVIRLTRTASVDYSAHAELTKKSLAKKTRNSQADEEEDDDDVPK